MQLSQSVIQNLSLPSISCFDCDMESNYDDDAASEFTFINI
jgi:hypothetical protein